MLVNSRPDAFGVRKKHDASHVESTKPEDVSKDNTSHDAELQIAQLKTEVDSLHQQLADRDIHIATAEDLRLHLQKQLSSHVAEISVSNAYIWYVGP